MNNVKYDVWDNVIIKVYYNFFNGNIIQTNVFSNVNKNIHDNVCNNLGDIDINMHNFIFSSIIDNRTISKNIQSDVLKQFGNVK